MSIVGIPVVVVGISALVLAGEWGTRYELLHLRFQGPS